MGPDLSSNIIKAFAMAWAALVLLLIASSFEAHASECAMLRRVGSESRWITQPCPTGRDCGEDDPEKYPWVVNVYRDGRPYGSDDYKTREGAARSMQIWEKFNNRTWPRGCQCGGEDRYRYEGPFRKCVVPPSGRASARKLSDAERALRDGAQALLRQWAGDALKAVRAFISLDSGPNPFRGVGSVLMEYGKTFSLVYKKLAEVRPQLELFTDNPMQEIADGLRKLSQELEASGTRMHEAFRGLPRDFQSVLQGDVQGRLQGDRLVTYYPNGAKRSETTYRSGREHGKRIEYYESGKKKSETDYSAGREHGKRVEWYESGEKHAETEYREGKRNGQAVQWCTNGRVELTATYRDDQEASRGATQPCQGTRTGTAVASLLFLIDVSGSMEGEKLNAAKQAAMGAIQKTLSGGSEAAVMAFSGDCASPIQGSVGFTQDKNKLVAFVQSLQAGGGTPLAAAVRQANRFMKSQKSPDSATQMILLLADGDDQCGDLDKVLDELRASKTIFRHETVGLGVEPYSAAVQQLEKIARVSGGRYHYAQHHAQLASIFAETVDTMEMLKMIGKFGHSQPAAPQGRQQQGQGDGEGSMQQILRGWK